MNEFLISREYKNNILHQSEYKKKFTVYALLFFLLLLQQPLLSVLFLLFLQCSFRIGYINLPPQWTASAPSPEGVF